MHVHMVCIYIYVCACMYVCAYTCMYIYIYIYIYIFIYIRLCVCVCVYSLALSTSAHVILPRKTSLCGGKLLAWRILCFVVPVNGRYMCSGTYQYACICICIYHAENNACMRCVCCMCTYTLAKYVFLNDSYCDCSLHNCTHSYI